MAMLRAQTRLERSTRMQHLYQDAENIPVTLDMEARFAIHGTEENAGRARSISSDPHLRLIPKRQGIWLLVLWETTQKGWCGNRHNIRNPGCINTWTSLWIWLLRIPNAWMHSLQN